MNVTTLDKEITAYVKSVRVEKDGEVYLVDVAYDEYDGYELTFIKDGKITETPQWATDWEETHSESLAYELDYESGGWQFATKEQFEKAMEGNE